MHELDFGIPSYVWIGSDIHDAAKHDLSRFAIRNHNQLAWANTGRQSDHGSLREYDDRAGVFREDLHPFRLARIRFDPAGSPNPNRNLKDADGDRNNLPDLPLTLMFPLAVQVVVQVVVAVSLVLTFPSVRRPFPRLAFPQEVQLRDLDPEPVDRPIVLCAKAVAVLETSEGPMRDCFGRPRNR